METTAAWLSGNRDRPGGCHGGRSGVRSGPRIVGVKWKVLAGYSRCPGREWASG